MLVAVGALAVWVGFLVVMGFAADAPNEEWTRLAYIFASVEAIAFTAAGALFGVTVQRERVAKAEEAAAENAQDASNGRALAAINIADEGQVVERNGETVFESFGPDDAKDAEVRRRHAAAARRLFPNV